MLEQSEKEKGYDECCNDIATALMELHRHRHFGVEAVEVKPLVERLQSLKKKRFHGTIST